MLPRAKLLWLVRHVSVVTTARRTVLVRKTTQCVPWLREKMTARPAMMERMSVRMEYVLVS